MIYYVTYAKKQRGVWDIYYIPMEKSIENRQSKRISKYIRELRGRDGNKMD